MSLNRAARRMMKRIARSARRAPVPETILLIPTGGITGSDGGTYRAADLNTVITATKEQAGGKPLVIGYADAPEQAAGQITDLIAERTGIWGKVEWTPLAKRRLASGELDFVRPVVAHDGEGRVSALLSATLCADEAPAAGSRA